MQKFYIPSHEEHRSSLFSTFLKGKKKTTKILIKRLFFN
jgi:hypothetical protein